MAAPVSPQERSFLPDVLRGLAIGGILLVNVQDFAGYVPWLQTGADGVARFLVDVLANGKFVSTFAMLFGAGAALGVARAGSGVQLRRLLTLLVLGVAHGTLVWHGDILATYALVGLVLLPLLSAPASAQAVFAVAGLGWGVVTILRLAVGAPAVPEDGAGIGVNPAYGAASYVGALPLRAEDFLGTLTSGTLFLGTWLLGLFLIGVLVARTGVLRDPARFRRPLLLTAALGLLVGVPLNLVFARLNATGLYDAQLWALLTRFLGGLTLALAYGALVALAVTTARGRALLTPLANAGRLALTHYLTQSVVCTLVFYGYGLGQYGRWGALACVLFALALYAVQVALSGIVLRRFGRGPAEWLLRRVVYGR
ncbi:DUF418 domain-containing protein [Deinococcus pimensis]|uniref:DUF418 domain-containing protein n=1 Tax=Deinococcus pimensis TaxID=309888 RepID=UPI0006943E7A|nr:DUF418 domain-containing protein [Deinococcus pimensis]